MKYIQSREMKRRLGYVLNIFIFGIVIIATTPLLILGVLLYYTTPFSSFNASFELVFTIVILIISLSISITIAYCVSHHFFYKQANIKNKSRAVFEESIIKIHDTLMAQLQKKPLIDNFKYAQYYCEMAKKGLESFDPSKIKHVIKIESCQKRIQNIIEYEKAKIELESTNLAESEKNRYQNIINKYDNKIDIKTEIEQIDKFIMEIIVSHGLDINKRTKKSFKDEDSDVLEFFDP